MILTLLLTILTTPLLMSVTPSDSVTSQHYRVYTGQGRLATFDDIVKAMRNTDVVFVGETHDDPVAHYLQTRLLEAAHQTYGQTETPSPRPVALSLEMFTRDVQYILDEYLQGLITERHFRSSSNPWQNYETDYRPAVEYAKAHGLAVVAANAPRRYVNRVTRLGPASLEELSDRAKAVLPPLPYAPATPAYKAKWDNLMQEAMAAMAPDTSSGDAAASPMMHSGPSYMLDSQSLWDASMAYSIAEHLMKAPGGLVLHYVGGFHVEGKTGTPEHLQRYRPGTRALVISVQPHEDLNQFDKDFTGHGDFVILTDESLPRSHERTF